MHKPLNTTYNFFYWGPLLFKIKMRPEDVKKCFELCSKKSNYVSEILAGQIKHQHYVNAPQYSKIINPYLGIFGHAYNHWYKKPFPKHTVIQSAWVNFMIAGEFNPPHIHNHCDFSSVLFLKIPEKLKEENKKYVGTAGGPGSLSFTYGESGPHIMFHKNFFPEEEDLFIFPADLKHFVSPFLSKGERISLSANFRLN